MPINGTNNGDFLNGTDAGDEINARGGSDVVYGGGGNDVINGQAGNDFLNGEDGDDQLNGGADTDTLHGGNGNDILNGGAGRDNLNGGAGTDTAVYEGRQSDYSISILTSNNVFVTDRNLANGNEGMDALTSIERIRFGDGTTLFLVPNKGPGPVTDSDASANSVEEGSANGTSVGLTALAIDPDSDAVTYSLVDNGGGAFGIDATTGEVFVADSTKLDYETATSLNITVRATDAFGATSEQAFTIQVTNAAPSTPVDADGATGGSVTEGAAAGTAVGITASSSDVNGGTVTYSLSDNAGGRFAINATTGVVTVADASLINYEGATSHNITVVANDGTATSAQTLTVAVTNAAPTAALDTNEAVDSIFEGASAGTPTGVTFGGSSDPNGGAVSYTLLDDAGGAFELDASRNLIVKDGSKIDYEAIAPDVDGKRYMDVVVRTSDGQLVTDQTFRVEVAPGPNAQDDAVTVQEDGSNAINVLANDKGASLEVTSVDTTGTQGSVQLIGGEITYSAGSAFQYLADGETAFDTFEYTVTDANGLTESATVTVTVEGENDAPIAADDSAFTQAGASVIVTVLANDSDPENDALSVDSVTTPAHGTATVNADGTVSYTPAAGYSGTDSFDYVVSDSDGATSVGTVSIVVGLSDHDQVGGDVFLQGNYMEIGVSASGSLGTANGAPGNYHPNNSGSQQISYVVDRDGWTSGSSATSNDFTLPGSPVDTIGFGFNGVSFIQDERSGVRQINTTTTDSSANGILSATTAGTIVHVSGSLRITQVIELDPSATYYSTTITVENVGATALSDVRFLRSFDPDQDALVPGGTYNTLNDVISNPSTGNDLAISSAQGPVSGVAVNLVAFDPDARASNYGFANYDVYDSQAWDAPVDLNGASVDLAITMEFKFGDLAVGETATKTFYTTLNGSSGANDMLVGGTGADFLDSGAGDDILIGASGADTLTGGVGNDKFIFARGSGVDVITDFTAGAGTDDVIELRGMGFADFAAVKGAAFQDGDDTVINLGSGDTLRLSGVDLASLHSDDFVFPI